MSLKTELLPGLPPYAGGKTSINVYNAGGGLYDERTIDASLPIPIEDGSVMPIGAFKTLINSLLKTYGGRWERCPETILSAKIFFNQRLLQVRYEKATGKITAFYADDYVPQKEDRSSYLRAVIKTKAEEFLNYIDALKAEGFEVIFENKLEENLFYELKKDDRLIYGYFTQGDRTARFIDDKVSCSINEFGYETPSVEEATEVYQYALKQSERVDGIVTDCGMLYIIKLSDGSLFVADGGAIEQATDETVETIYQFMREKASGDKIRIACWFCTHAHADHMILFAKLLRQYHEDIDLQRVMFNFPSSEYRIFEPQCYLTINRINQYYPHVTYLKPHAGQSFMLSNAQFEILQTHECYTAYGCNEMPEDFNDTSTVLKITFDGKVFLMLGDVNKIGEAQLLKHYSEATLKSDLVQAAHHLFNTLYYIYDIAEPEYILVPTRVESKTNHDKGKYARLVLSRTDDQVFFASDEGTHGFAVRGGKLTRIYHDKLHGGEYDGSDM